MNNDIYLIPYDYMKSGGGRESEGNHSRKKKSERRRREGKEEWGRRKLIRVDITILAVV